MSSMAATVEGNGGAVVAQLADRWAARDAERMRELNELIRSG